MLGHAAIRILNNRIINLDTINQLLKKESHKKILYNVYYPNEIEKKVSDNVKEAIDEIAFANLPSTLTCLEQLFAELKRLGNTAESPFIHLQSALAPLKSKAELELTDYKKLCDFLNDSRKNLENYLKKIAGKVKPEAQKIMDEICYVWLEGLYLQACIQIDRKQVQAIIFNANNSEELVPHPVADANMSIPIVEAEAINHISAFEAEQSLPVLLSILAEIEEIIKDLDLPKSKDAMAYALKTLKWANEKLYTPVGEIGKVLGEFVTQLLPSLNGLIQKLNECELTPQIRFHADELIVWLDGLYAHAFNPPERGLWAKKKEQVKEFALKQGTGKSKKELSIYYHEDANAIRQGRAKLMNELRATQEAKSDEQLNAAPAASVQENIQAELNVSNTEELISFKLSNQLELTVKISDATLAKQIAALSTPENLLLLNDFFTGKTKLIRANVQQDSLQDELNKRELEIWNLLNQAKFSSKQVKIDTLHNTIKRFDLVPDQLNQLLYLKGKAAASVEGYINDTYFKEYLGSLSAKLFPRKNSDVADQTLSNINKPSFDDSENPQDILQELFNARIKLMEKKKSHTLLPGIEDLLLEAYDHLLNKTPCLILDERKKQIEHKQKVKVFGSKKQTDKNEMTPEVSKRKGLG